MDTFTEGEEHMISGGNSHQTKDYETGPNLTTPKVDRLNPQAKYNHTERSQTSSFAQMTPQTVEYDR